MERISDIRYGPDISPPLGTSEYWEKHKQLVHLLGHLGIKYKYKQRLPLFELHLAIQGWKQKDEFAKAALDLIAQLVELRQEGQEPKVKGSVYI